MGETIPSTELFPKFDAFSYSQNGEFAAKAPANENIPPSSGSKSKSIFELEKFTLKFESGIGSRSFNDGKGFGPVGKYFRTELGYHLNDFGAITLTPHVFFDYQDFKGPFLGKLPIPDVKAVGAGVDVGYNIHPFLFSVHALLGIGAAFHSSSGKDYPPSVTIGESSLHPVNDTGLRVGTALRACTLSDGICLGLMFSVDRIRTSGSIRDYPTHFGIEAKSLMGGLSLDLIRVAAGIAWGIALYRDLGGL